MNKILYILLFILSANLNASSFGTTGIIDIPTARMEKDATLKISFSHQDIANITNITYQATPWLETTFRYSYGSFHKDRSYSAKALLINEGEYIPSVAIGIKDIIGTGIWASEYIVASKRINNFDLTLGLGWGRLADRNNFKNPLIGINDDFILRNVDPSIGGQFGGQSRAENFFKGAKVGVFGGIKYMVPNTNFNLLVEYNTDSYEKEVNRGFTTIQSPLNFGIEWQGTNGINFRLGHLQGNQIGILLAAKLNTKVPALQKSIESLHSSYDLNKLSGNAKSLNFASWYDRLLYDFELSGLLLRRAAIATDKNSVIIEFSNFRYNLTADAIKRALALTQLHIPDKINKISLLLNENGYKPAILEFNRSQSANGFIFNNYENIIKIKPSKEITKPTNITKFKTPAVQFRANLAVKYQVFDPDEPFKRQIYLKLESLVALPQSWNLYGAYSVDINNNFDLNRGPNSRLEHVRTDINRYLVEGESGLDSLYLERYSTINNKLYSRFYAGVLETMYSGIGAEILYQPFLSRIAIGASVNKVYKRGYKRNFDLLDYNTSTGFLSIYYASPFYNYDLALHIGRYLAKDKGMTFEIRRTFDNGFSVGAFATKTNVSAADFGEGSFDKGLFFRIPFNSLSNKNTKVAYSALIRSIQRDGGQRLEDFTGRLWHDLRNVRYDSLNNNKKRMIPK